MKTIFRPSFLDICIVANICFILICIFSCKEKFVNNNIQSSDYLEKKIPVENQSNEYRYSEIPGEILLNDVDSNLSISVVNYRNIKGKTTVSTLVEYLRSLHYKSETKYILIEGLSYLVISHFTYGANCCVLLEIFNKNTNGVYELIDSYSYGGESIELKYPFNLGNSFNYFYSTGVANINFNCDGGNYSEKLYLIRNQLKFVASGELEQLKSCVLKYFNTIKIPELNENKLDNGERKELLYLFYKLASLSKSLNILNEQLGWIKLTYEEKFPHHIDKAETWSDIIDNLLDKLNFKLSDLSIADLKFIDNQYLFREQNTPDNSKGITYTYQYVNRADELNCYELLNLVENEGSELKELHFDESESEALEYIALYEYESEYYNIVVFQSGGKYIYCGIQINDWEDFLNDLQYSVGKSWNEHLNYSNCSCD